MTAKELIARLQKFNPDAEVTFTIKSLKDLRVDGVNAFFDTTNSHITRVETILTL